MILLVRDHLKMFHYRPEGVGRDEDQSPDDDHYRDQPRDKERLMRRQGAGTWRNLLFGGERPGNRQYGDLDPETSEEHGDCTRGVIENRVRVQARKRTPIVIGLRKEGIEDFGEPMRAGVQSA